MQIHKLYFLLMIMAALMLGACAPAATKDVMMDKPAEVMVDEPGSSTMEDSGSDSMDKTNDTMADKAADEMMEKPTEEIMDKPEDTMMGESSEDMMDMPAWFGTTLTNVTTGEGFTINNFKGKVVLVETMAQWCSNCKRQQMEVKSLLDQMGMPDDLVMIGLDIDPNETSEMLKEYAAKNGFDWIYAVSPAEVSREIGNLYGGQFLNPPSTPILVIDRKGEVHPMPFGFKSVDDLTKFIEPFLKDM